jgi:hypothetical protein
MDELRESIVTLLGKKVDIKGLWNESKGAWRVLERFECDEVTIKHREPLSLPPSKDKQGVNQLGVGGQSE